MSREPSNPLHREWQYLVKAEPPPKEEQPKASPPKRVPRVRVENPTQDPGVQKMLREKAFRKFSMTTEALSEEERKIIRGYRISRRDLGMED